MLVFVDLEHAGGHHGEMGTRILAARTWITYRLEDLSGRHCHLVRYHRIDDALLHAVDAEALFISGNSIGPDEYPPGELDRLCEIVRHTELPVFGFCGGLQLLAMALGTAVVPIEPGPEAAEDPSITATSDGAPFEFGYFPITLADGHQGHPLLDGLGANPVFRHAHGLHVPHLPDGFVNLASTPTTPVQMAVDERRRIVGTQFHPEYWSDEHPEGRILIANFLRWVDLSAREEEFVPT